MWWNWLQRDSGGPRWSAPAPLLPLTQVSVEPSAFHELVYVDAFVCLVRQVRVTRATYQRWHVVSGWLDHGTVGEVRDRRSLRIQSPDLAQHVHRSGDQWPVGVDTDRWIVTEQRQGTVEARGIATHLIHDGPEPRNQGIATDTRHSAYVDLGFATVGHEVDNGPPEECRW